MAPLPPLKQSTNDLAPAWLKSNLQPTSHPSTANNTNSTINNNNNNTTITTNITNSNNIVNNINNNSNNNAQQLVTTTNTAATTATLISNGSTSSSSSVWDGNVKIKVLNNPISKLHRYYRSRVLINRLEASTTVNNIYLNNNTTKQSTALSTPSAGAYNGITTTPAPPITSSTNNHIRNTYSINNNNTNNYNQLQQQQPLHHQNHHHAERKESINGHRLASLRHYQVQQQQQKSQPLPLQQQQPLQQPQQPIPTIDTNYNQHNYLKYRQHTIAAQNPKIKSAWSDDDGSSDNDENEEDDLSDEQSPRQVADELKTSDANNYSNSDTTIDNNSAISYKPTINGAPTIGENATASSEPIVINKNNKPINSLNSSSPKHHRHALIQEGAGCYKNGFQSLAQNNHLRNNEQDDLEGNLSRSPMSEEERRLLRTMGWKEDGDDDLYAPLTEDEVQEFVERFKKLQMQNGGTTSSNKLIKANTSLNRRLASDKDL